MIRERSVDKLEEAATAYADTVTRLPVGPRTIFIAGAEWAREQEAQIWEEFAGRLQKELEEEMGGDYSRQEWVTILRGNANRLRAKDVET
jgi:hypothetical protein